MADSMKNPFRKGDRVRLSPAGLAQLNPREAREGAVARDPTTPLGVAVRWDGMRTVHYFAVRFVEAVSALSERAAGSP